jgi:hypothetical protein
VTPAPEQTPRPVPNHEDGSSARTGYDTLDAAYGAATVQLILELRPDLPIPVAASLAVELLEQARVDAAWVERRASVDPHVTVASFNRHAGHSYAQRRALELQAVHDG